MQNPLVRVSIIIPTYNRPRQIAACLESLCLLRYPRDAFEVIVVDDGSRPPVQVTAGGCSGERFDLRCIAQPNSGPAAARNTAVAQATGELLAFIDDDCRPDPDWLGVLAQACRRLPGHAIGGRTVNALPDNMYSTASQILVNLLYAHCNAGPEGPKFFATNNLAVPADRFHIMGGFEPRRRTAEDRDFCDRWREHGYPLAYLPSAVVYHAHKLGFRSFWRQQFAYGYGGFHFHRARSRRGLGSFAPATALYWRILTYAFAAPGIRIERRIRLAGLLAASQVAIAAGIAYAWVRLKRGRGGE